MSFNGLFDAWLGPLVAWSPLGSMLIITLVLAVIITVIYKYTTNQKLMKELKDEMKSYQAKIKEHKDNPQKMMKLQKEMMEKNMRYMKHSMKPTLITFIPLIIFYAWLKQAYGDTPLLFGLGWIWTYIIFSIVFSSIFRKLLRIY